MFRVPSGKAGNTFGHELSRLFREYANGSCLESIALKAAMIFPILLLQKPFPSSKKQTAHSSPGKTTESNGMMVTSFVRDAASRNNYAKIPDVSPSSRIKTRVFVKLKKNGKVNAALRLLSNQNGGGPLPLDFLVNCGNEEEKSVRDILKQKHSAGQPLQPSALTNTNSDRPHPVIFEQINVPLIRSIALRTFGSAGPSGVDAASWRRLCTSFHKASGDLCDSLALCAIRICTEYVNPSGLTALVASRLVSLDKNPDVRPIGIGECSRRIISKAVLSIIRQDILETTGSIKLCAGEESGCEAAVHAMRAIFEDKDTQAILLIDAKNAFNSINRQTALRNIQGICPSLSTITTNTYHSNPLLFIDGETIPSCEGTTQGDTLAMAIYAVATIPLIKQLKKKRRNKCGMLTMQLPVVSYKT